MQSSLSTLEGKLPSSATCQHSTALVSTYGSFNGRVDYILYSLTRLQVQVLLIY